MIAARAENLLLRPSSLAALALLALNDHVLKARFPGFWTGKLSDFAGLYFSPFFLVAVAVMALKAPGSRRTLASACVLTALVFSWVNLSPTASDVYEHVVGEAWRLLGAARRIRHVADAEDLIALPMVAVAYLVGATALERTDRNARVPHCPAPVARRQYR